MYFLIGKLLMASKLVYTIHTEQQSATEHQAHPVNEVLGVCAVDEKVLHNFSR